jgi:hypothetical protein
VVDWLQAEYREFHDYPRMMVCTNPRGTYFFWSRFDETKKTYANHYEVYRIKPFSESEPCASWFGIESRAVERLPDIPVRDFPFDVRNRKFLPYDSIVPVLTAES